MFYTLYLFLCIYMFYTVYLLLGITCYIQYIFLQILHVQYIFYTEYLFLSIYMFYTIYLFQDLQITIKGITCFIQYIFFRYYMFYTIYIYFRYNMFYTLYLFLGITCFTQYIYFQVLRRRIDGLINFNRSCVEYKSGSLSKLFVLVKKLIRKQKTFL